MRSGTPALLTSLLCLSLGCGGLAGSADPEPGNTENPPTPAVPSNVAPVEPAAPVEAAPDPGAAPTPAQIVGTWPRLSKLEGREVTFVNACQGGAMSIRSTPETIGVDDGQEGFDWKITGSSVSGGALVLTVTRSDLPGGGTLSVRRDGAAWVWEGAPVEVPWRTAADPAAFPRMQSCCSSTVDDPEEVEYAVVAHDVECPPVPE